MNIYISLLLIKDIIVNLVIKPCFEVIIYLIYKTFKYVMLIFFYEDCLFFKDDCMIQAYENLKCDINYIYIYI